MIANGWKLYCHPLIEDQLRRLTARVEALALREPEEYRTHPEAKLLTTLHRYLFEIIPRDPGAAEFRQGNSLGRDNRHWFRAKFHQRYRLLYRFSSESRIIIYAWVSDERTLRKAGARSDPYSVFRGLLEAGDPPGSMDELFLRSREIQP